MIFSQWIIFSIVMFLGTTHGSYCSVCNITEGPVLELDHTLKEGDSFIVSGKILDQCVRFMIDLLKSNSSDQIVLHINPRIPQKNIVRNTRTSEAWGTEETISKYPFMFKCGEKFIIQVLVTEACYMIAINGQHFAEYAHRLPYNLVKTLEVHGDVSNVSIQHSLVSEYPTIISEPQTKQINLREPQPGINSLQNTYDKLKKYIPKASDLAPSSELVTDITKENCQELSLPYYGTLADISLTKGYTLLIEGSLENFQESFSINLQTGQHVWPHPVVGFHLNTAFLKRNKAIIRRNAWFNGKWDVEELSQVQTTLLKDKLFNLAIVCGESAYEVYINNMYMTSFLYRVLPEDMDTIYIEGQIKLCNVVLENHKLNLLNNNKTISDRTSYVKETKDEIIVIEHEQIILN